MTDICRLCASLKTLDQLQMIQDPTLSLKQKLARCCQFEFPVEDDFLPQSVCSDCILCLNNSWTFSEKVLQAQETLKRAFLIDYDTNEALLKNEILALEQQQQHQQQQEQEHQQQHQQIDFVEGNQFNRRKKKQPTRVSVDGCPSAIADGKLPEKKMHELSFKIRSIIISLHTKGYTNQQISSKLNISEQTVSEWIYTYQSQVIDSTNHSGTNFKLEINEPMIEVVPIQHQPIIIETVSSIQAIPKSDDIQIDMKKDPEVYELSNQMEFQTIGQTSVDDTTNHQQQADNLTEYSNHNYTDNDDDNDADDDDDDNEGVASDNDYDGTDILGLNDEDKNPDGTIAESGLDKIDQTTWNDYQWNCYDCGIIATSLKNLRAHYSSNHTATSLRYVCIDCSKTFNKFVSFVLHVQRNHRPYLKYCCDTCFKYFWNTNSLREHRRREHANKEKAFLCQTCGKGFRSSSTLHVHSRCHLPIDIKNTYKCDICFKKFGTKPNLSAHKRIHAGVRDFTCDQCGKSFVQKGNLDNHLLTHVSNKPYTCDMCRKSFKTQLRLLKHKTVHTGFKPHKCDVCGREFREKGTLREHIRIHTGAMPFTCEYCGKRFRFKGVLTTHRRQHTGERPYSCVECNHHFTNWPNYNKHMKRRHGINTSVTVRKPQAIPPSGMPAKAKLNHVVPTVHNLGLVQPSIPPDTTDHIENNEILDTICGDKDIINVDEPEGKYVTTTVVPSVVAPQTTQTLSATGIQDHSEIISQDLTENCQSTQITVLAHPAERSIHQVLNAQNHSIHPTATQYSYIPTGTAMLGFYNLQGVDIDLMQNANLQR